MRYFMHLGGASGLVTDEEGRDLPDENTARIEAIAAARDVMAGDLQAGQLDLTTFIAVENDAHELLFRITFEEAVAIFPHSTY